jgi:AraC-like DNA-binding protein
MTRGTEEYRDSKARTAGDLGSAPSATLEAESTLQSLVSSLTNPNFSSDELPSLMKMYMLSLRLLGISDEWPSKELKGYSNIKQVPSYRRSPCDTKYVEAKSGKVVEKKRDYCEFYQSLVFIVNNYKGGWLAEIKRTNKIVKGKLVATKKVMVPGWRDIKVVLERIGEELFDRATKTLVAARFGSAIDTIFREYQKSVGSELSNLEVENHLETAYRNLKGGDEASWRAAALACRNVLHDISTKLWCVQCSDYNFGDGRGLVKLNNPRIKLRAYMREKGLNKKDTPVSLLEPVYADASAAKTKCSYEDARSVLILTYLFLAELIRQTDMETVIEIKEVSSKSKK